MDTELKSGGVYKVHHARKGVFTMQVHREAGGWVQGAVVDGEAGAINPANLRMKGEPIQVRKSLCTFTSV